MESIPESPLRFPENEGQGSDGVPRGVSETALRCGIGAQFPSASNPPGSLLGLNEVVTPREAKPRARLPASQQAVIAAFLF